MNQASHCLDVTLAPSGWWLVADPPDGTFCGAHGRSTGGGGGAPRALQQELVLSGQNAVGEVVQKKPKGGDKHSRKKHSAFTLSIMEVMVGVRKEKEEKGGDDG